MFSFSRNSETGAATGWTLAAYVYALLVAATIGYFLLDIPIQVTDSFGNLLTVADSTLGSLVYRELYQQAFLRPLLWANIHVVYTLADGQYFAWFRGWHVAQVVVLAVLFVRLLRPRTAAEAAAVPIGLAALVGIHTFTGTVVEAFPINTFLTIVVCCFAAADLALGPPRWWRSVLAWVLFVFAAMTVESGLLVAVVFVVAFATGARGVSRAGVAGVLVLFAGYFYLRFVYLDVGSPNLMERSSGFGFSSLDPGDLTARFGANPLPFYAYNVLTSIASVLFAEPRGGVFGVTRDAMAGEWLPASVFAVVASTLGTILIGRYAWVRRQQWRLRQFDRGDQLTILFVVVMGANAAISYAYTKEVILSPAGGFFAIALAVAVADASGTLRRTSVARAAALTMLLLAAASAWAFRATTVALALRAAASTARNEWVYVQGWIEEQRIEMTPAAAALRDNLRDVAIRQHPAPPALWGDWVEWFEE